MEAFREALGAPGIDVGELLGVLQSVLVVPEESGDNQEAVHLDEQSVLSAVGLDGIALWSAVAELERHQDKRVPDAAVRECVTVGDLLALFQN